MSDQNVIFSLGSISMMLNFGLGLNGLEAQIGSGYIKKYLSDLKVFCLEGHLLQCF